MALLLLATTSNCGFVSIRSASTGECLDTSLGGPTHLLVDLYACVSDGHNERFTIDAANSVIRLGPGDQGPENGSCLLAMPDGSLSQAKCNSSLVRHQPPTTSHSSACQQTDLWSYTAAAGPALHLRRDHQDHHAGEAVLGSGTKGQRHVAAPAALRPWLDRAAVPHCPQPALALPTAAAAATTVRPNVVRPGSLRQREQTL